MAGDEGAQRLYEYLRTLPSRPIPFGPSGASKGVLGKPCILAGYAFRETAGAIATMEFYSGQDIGGILVAVMALAAGGFDTEITTEHGPLCEGGLYISIVTGTVKGAVWAKFEG